MQVSHAAAYLTVAQCSLQTAASDVRSGGAIYPEVEWGLTSMSMSQDREDGKGSFCKNMFNLQHNVQSASVEWVRRHLQSLFLLGIICSIKAQQQGKEQSPGSDCNCQGLVHLSIVTF